MPGGHNPSSVSGQIGVKSSAAIDTSLPKSIEKSQIVRDRSNKRRAASRSGSRPQSRTVSRPCSQQNGYYNDDDWGEADDEEESEVYTIMRNVLKPPQSASNQATVDSESARHDFSLDKTLKWPADNITRPSSARSNQTVLSTHSVRTRTRRNPDLLATHAHVFTEPAKPFTPRTLKTDRQSRLADYRYYNPPPKKTEKSTKVDHKNVPLDNTKASETSMMYESLASRDYSRRIEGREMGVPPLDISIDTDNLRWLKDQADHAKRRMHHVEASHEDRSVLSSVKEASCQDASQRAGLGKIDPGDREDYGAVDQGHWGGAKDARQFHSILKPSRAHFTSRSGGGDRSWAGQRLSAEEEELKYVEFVKDVTTDILARGIYTNRVLLQVFENHLQRRLHDLDETKMRSKLRTLRMELGVPSEKVHSMGLDAVDSHMPSTRNIEIKNIGQMGDTGQPTRKGETEEYNSYNVDDKTLNNDTYNLTDGHVNFLGDFQDKGSELGETYELRKSYEQDFENSEKSTQRQASKRDKGKGLDDVSVEVNGGWKDGTGRKASGVLGDTFHVTSTWHSMDDTAGTMPRGEEFDKSIGGGGGGVMTIGQSLDECASEFGSLVVDGDGAKVTKEMNLSRKKKPKLKPRTRKDVSVAKPEEESSDVIVSNEKVGGDDVHNANGTLGQSRIENNEGTVSVEKSTMRGVGDAEERESYGVNENSVISHVDEVTSGNEDNGDNYDEDNDFEDDIEDESDDKPVTYRTSDEDF